jgi:hypothetical protein
MLDPAAGAAAEVPSMNPFVASPQATESIGVPPTGRKTTAPPVAAKPPEYVASAGAAKIPAPFATSRCLPGSRTRLADHVALRVTVDPVEVAYTSSRPMRSTARDPAFAISANSSEAEAPPVWISEITRVDVGHATAAVPRRGSAPAGRLASESGATAVANDATIKTRTRANGKAVDPARRARDIDDLPAGLSDGGPQRWFGPDGAGDGCSRRWLPADRSSFHDDFVVASP